MFGATMRAPRALWLLLVVSAVLGDRRCSLNGDYDSTSESCHCDAAWTGEACDVLSVGAVDRNTSHGYRNSSGYNSWGGNVLKVGDEWHLFVAQFVNKCTLENWGTNSEIVHAVSTTGPSGPFAVEDTAVPVFAHNPTIRQVGRDLHCCAKIMRVLPQTTSVCFTRILRLRCRCPRLPMALLCCT